MKKYIRGLAFFLFFTAVNPFYMHAEKLPPGIQNIELLTPAVEQYGKFELRIMLSTSYSNPYDYEEVSVGANFMSPSGNSVWVDGFYMQDYNLNTTTGNLSLVGGGDFRLRFAPPETGSWTVTVAVTDATGTTTAEPLTFSCNSATTSANHGFLRTGTSNYLQFDDGTPYIAIGENMAWQNSNPFLNYRVWLEGLGGQGGNFFRLWHAHWGLGVEWRTGNGFAGLRRYKQTNCYYQDWLFDYCAENGIYVMLALQHHGPVSTQVNPNWNDSPYNVANGGPCQNTLEFFTNEEARAHTKNRYRYIVARWGYARSILCWELFNEVHWTDNFQVNINEVASWHMEMAAYLKSIDPYQHLVTTSYGDDTTDENVWSHPDIDLTQTHMYINSPNIERALGLGNRTFLDIFEKPTLNGEFGLGISATLANEDPEGIHIHNAMWGGLFSGAFGTAMTWWWDNYIHPQDLYYHFSGLSQITSQIPFAYGKMKPATAHVEGAPGDLTLTPSLGWGNVGTANISIDAQGQVSPENTALGQFLYGSQWNTQFRSPPNFSVSYPTAGTFTVRTSGETGTDPKIAIWLNGSMMLQQNATVNTAYTINVPAGNHTIKVDNTGTDWVTIAGYTFEGLGSQIDIYALVSEDKKVASGWALNNLYNHKYIDANGEPDATPLASVKVEGFDNGAFDVNYFDPLTGAFLTSDQAIASNGQLDIPLPSFLWDVVFVVSDGPVATREVRENLEFEVYPNPVMAGEDIALNMVSQSKYTATYRLLDESGKVIQKNTGNEAFFTVNSSLPAGFYWLSVEQGGKVGARPIVVGRR